MIGKLRSLLGRKDPPAPPPLPPYAPYGNVAANAMYNLLFCDAPDAFRTQPGRAPGVESLRAATSALLAAPQAVVDRIGTWDKARLPPPGRDRVRLSFLVSDDLYFGDGEMSVMSREALGGPVIARAGELLQLVVATATK
jgi:hypothetical protein